MSYSTEVLADSPLVYLRLGDLSGTTATDSSGNGRNGSYQNTPTLGATGLLLSDSDKAMGTAANTGQSARITSASWMDSLSAFTVEVLVSLSSATDGGNGDALASRYGSGGFQWLLWRNTAGQFAVQARNSGGTFFNVASGSTVTLNTTYHVAATWDGSNLRLYVNGSSVGTPAAMTTLGTTTEDIWVAVYSQAAATTPGGTFDEFAFYGTALSGARLAAHYAAAFDTSQSGTASLSLSATGGASVAGAGSATLALSATGAAVSGTMAAGGTASLALSGSGAANLGASGSASLSLGATGAASPLYVADTSNALDGLDITFVATADVPTPVAAVPPSLVPGERFEVALPYPVPVMVDGRPT